MDPSPNTVTPDGTIKTAKTTSLLSAILHGIYALLTAMEMLWYFAYRLRGPRCMPATLWISWGFSGKWTSLSTACMTIWLSWTLAIRETVRQQEGAGWNVFHQRQWYKSFRKGLCAWRKQTGRSPSINFMLRDWHLQKTDYSSTSADPGPLRHAASTSLPTANCSGAECRE